MPRIRINQRAMSDNVIHLTCEIRCITSRRNIAQWEAGRSVQASRCGPVTFPGAFRLRLWRCCPSLGEEVCISARDNRGRARQLIKDRRTRVKQERAQARMSLFPRQEIARRAREKERTWRSERERERESLSYPARSTTGSNCRAYRLFYCPTFSGPRLTTIWWPVSPTGVSRLASESDGFLRVCICARNE